MGKKRGRVPGMKQAQRSKPKRGAAPLGFQFLAPVVNVGKGPSKEMSEDEYWEMAATWSGDPTFRERFPKMMELRNRAMRLAAAELGLETYEEDGSVLVRTGEVPNIIAYEAAAKVLPEEWFSVMDPFPHGGELDFGYHHEDLPPGDDLVFDEQNDQRAAEVWLKIRPLLEGTET